ncbi:MAG: TIGR03545 family protein [Gemmatimonadales bacterium]
MQIKIFRWKAIAPLLLALIGIGVLGVLFAEPVAEETTEDVSTDLLGTQVDVSKLDLRPREIGADLWRIEVADPFDMSRNLVEAGSVHLTVDPEALAEKKLVVRNLALRGMQFGTKRETPARPARGDGFAPQMVRAVRQWASQFDVPLLKLTPIDTIRALALDPTKLGTVQAATSLAARTDSTRRAIEQGLRGVPVGPTIDSARALVARLDTLNPRTLGIQGTRDAIASVQRSIRQVEDAKRQIETLGKDALRGVNQLGAGLKEVDEARRRDYEFARSLLQLPSFAAPAIGKAFFGQVSVERFQQAMYWVQLGRHYMPPGLLPRETTGPDRLRMAGSTVRFPKERTYPSFLLEAGNVDFTLAGEGVLAGRYAATVRGLTSAPALYGKPTVISARRRADGPVLAALRVDAVLDHLTTRTRDSISAIADGVGLPAFNLPGLPVRLDPGSGRSGLSFVLRGDEIRGRWSVASNKVQWTVDTSARRLNEIERIVWRVLSGLTDLRVTAVLSGTVKAPKLGVSTNLDQAVSARLQAVVGEELAMAEQKVRAEVDKLVAAKTEEVRQQVAAVETEGRQRVEAERQKLEEVEQQLRGELKDLTAGIQIPGLRLPL